MTGEIPSGRVSRVMKEIEERGMLNPAERRRFKPVRLEGTADTVLYSIAAMIQDDRRILFVIVVALISPIISLIRWLLN